MKRYIFKRNKYSKDDISILQDRTYTLEAGVPGEEWQHNEDSPPSLGGSRSVTENPF